MKISLQTARRLAVRSQGLAGDWPPSGKEGVATMIGRLGFVQIDTISVIQRAHHHTLWTRSSDYQPEMLHELQAHERRVFEYWVHAAAYLPMDHYRYYLTRMRTSAASQRTRHWLAENKGLVDEVLSRIRHEGPLGSSDFSPPEGFQRGTWWSRTPAKVTLEALSNMGTLMVSERRNFSRRYDLTERVLPGNIDAREPRPAELARFRALQSLDAHGLVTMRTRKRNPGGTAVDRAPLEEGLASGEVVAVEVEGLERPTHYALASELSSCIDVRPDEPRLHLLSPFDSLIIDRQRLQNLFSFDYRLECYTPRRKRRYGYYCLPILWGTEFVGRLDPKANRKERQLIVRSLHFEPTLQPDEQLLSALSSRIWDLADSNGCDVVLVEQVEPASLKANLLRVLHRAH